MNVSAVFCNSIYQRVRDCNERDGCRVGVPREKCSSEVRSGKLFLGINEMCVIDVVRFFGQRKMQ
jgi:hypothetical protein